MSFIARCYTHINWIKSKGSQEHKCQIQRDRLWRRNAKYSVYSASNVRCLCALLCPAISFLYFHSCIFMSCNFMSCIFMSCIFSIRHFHVLQFHVLQVGPSFSRPAISCSANWSDNFTSVIFTSSIFSAPPIVWQIGEYAKTLNYGCRCFAVAGPSTWNSLPDTLRDPALSLDMFRRQLKTCFLWNMDEMYSAR